MTADSCCHAERYPGFDSFHSSNSRWSETPCFGECCPAPATRRVQTQRSAAKTQQPRSAILDRPEDDLAGLEIRAAYRATGNRDLLAPQAFQTILVEVIPTQTTWPSKDPFGDPEAHPRHGIRQSDMGSTTGARRTEKTGIQDFRANRLAPYAQEDRKPIADLDDVPSKSRRPNGLGRLLHGGDHTASSAVCLRHPSA